jgi:hypothetical protein
MTSMASCSGAGVSPTNPVPTGGGGAAAPDTTTTTAGGATTDQLVATLTQLTQVVGALAQTLQSAQAVQAQAQSQTAQTTAGGSTATQQATAGACTCCSAGTSTSSGASAAPEQERGDASWNAAAQAASQSAGRPASTSQAAAGATLPAPTVIGLPPAPGERPDQGSNSDSSDDAPPRPNPNQEPVQSGDAGGVRQRIVQIARGELGVRETGGEDRGDRIVDYRKAVFGSGESATAAEAWCADFASWVTREAGVPIGRNGRGEDYVSYVRDWAKDAGKYFGNGNGTPQPGDLVVFDWGDGGKLDHIGVVESVDGGNITTFEGNASDSVARRTYSLSDSDVVGFVRTV